MASTQPSFPSPLPHPASIWNSHPSPPVNDHQELANRMSSANILNELFPPDKPAPVVVPDKPPADTPPQVLYRWKQYVEYMDKCTLISKHSVEVRNANLAFVNVQLDSPPQQVRTAQSLERSCHVWNFRIVTVKSLRAACFLRMDSLREFSIAQVVTQDHSTAEELIYSNSHVITPMWHNPAYVKEDVYSEYRIRVEFRSSIFGTFTQTIVLDFGCLPLLTQTFQVDVVAEGIGPTIQEEETCRITTNEWRFDPSKCEIVKFQPTQLTEDDIHLYQKYPPPSTDIVKETVGLERGRLNAVNYRPRMHMLLQVEELSQMELIARYNLSCEIELADRYIHSTSHRFAMTGELFAHVKLNSYLTEDTSSGSLLLNSCSSVLILFDPEKARHAPSQQQIRVYEALIEDKANQDLYLRLPTKCISDLSLVHDTMKHVEIQFQLNRLTLCELHYAVDRLPSLDLVFPDRRNVKTEWHPDDVYDIPDVNLNTKQLKALKTLLVDSSDFIPPILLLGPYGTGKTYTLAQAVLLILKKPNTRILICTHSNSAADLYITEYLDPYVKAGNTEARPLRIYYTGRWVQTVPAAVLPYCISKTDPITHSRIFLLPTVETILQHRIVVVTFSMSRCLSQLALQPGVFTHILLDEVAQVVECEALLPLSLADHNSRIILAGDPMQLSPQVYSKLGRACNLHKSLLERLYNFYLSTEHPCLVFLTQNYRSHPEIVKFTASNFYETELHARSFQPPHPYLAPLTFSTAKGKEVCCGTTSYYNMAEAYECVKRVQEILKSWPEEWGPVNASEVGVVSPYIDQVFRIRSLLRSHRLGRISVERVVNIQGKQFRALIVSVVRTREGLQVRNPLPPNSSLVSEIAEEDSYGFLSDEKLMITALTRARSLLLIVGDPVTLCTVGKCSKLWKCYLKSCAERDGMLGVSFDALRIQLDNLEVGVNSSLNPSAPEFVPRSSAVQPPQISPLLPFLPLASYLQHGAAAAAGGGGGGGGGGCGGGGMNFGQSLFNSLPGSRPPPNGPHSPHFPSTPPFL